MRKLLTIYCAVGVLLCVGNTASSAAFQKGLDVDERGDYATAWREWRPLAEHGNASAQVNLGHMYDEGQGVPQDYKTAVKWYRLADEQGNARAQYNLGAMNYNGQVFLQDYVRAHMWWNIAASQGDEDATKYRDKVAKTMTPADISKAQDFARECVKKNYKGC